MNDNTFDTIIQTENAIRRVLKYILFQKYGENWLIKAGIKPEWISDWECKQIKEKGRRPNAHPDLLKFADFYQLIEIVTNRKNYTYFEPVFGKDGRNKLNVYLSEILKLRTAQAHGRELFPFEDFLTQGMTSEIRIQIAKYMNEIDEMNEFFPRIESVHDTLGNTWERGEYKSVNSGEKFLNPGEEIEFIISAIDPNGKKLEYGVGFWGGEINWSTSNKLKFCMPMKFRKVHEIVAIQIRGIQDYHAKRDYDDDVEFYYNVRPVKK